MQKYLIKPKISHLVILLAYLQKTCAICLGSLETGQGQAIFTAECSHSFHFGCISNSVSHGNLLCPICRATWKDLPFLMPINSRPNYTNNDTDRSLDLFTQSRPLQRHSLRSFSSTEFPPLQQQPRRHHPVHEPEPLQFSDDEPLPDSTSDRSRADLQNVTIKAIPECQAVASSESVPHFAVLVGVRAPPQDEIQSQRAPIDLVTVLDISSSMNGLKLLLLKRAVLFVIDNLGPADRLSIVSFSSRAWRIFPLRRMTEHGRDDAKRAIISLSAGGSTNIVEGLKKGVQVLEERRHQNPVPSIIFLSDGRDTCHSSNSQPNSRQPPQYLHLLPPSICPNNKYQGRRFTFPVHAFGFGTDHDPLAMHAIADSSTGTFSFIESYEMVQDAFASCIGGLLSVVAQQLRLTVKSASRGVVIKSIPSGRYASEISDQGSLGTIEVGDLYADEEKEFLINLAVPKLTDTEEGERKTSLLDIICSYRNIISDEIIDVQGDLVEIRRPESPSSEDRVVNLEVDRQINRVNTAESIAEAQRMAETGNLTEARTLLSNRRSRVHGSASGQAGDGLSMWLEAEMKETEERMGSRQMYEERGRAYALSNMSAHGYQRATTRGSNIPTVFDGSDAGRLGSSSSFGGYVTPLMATMVNRSQQSNNPEDVTPREE